MDSIVPQAMNDSIIIVEEQRAETSSGGVILLTDHVEDSLRKGTVVSVGPGKLLPDGSRVTLPLEVGERIMFSRMAGVELKYEEGSYLVLPFRFVVAVVD